MAWGRGLLLGMRWAARNSPAPEALLRNPVGRTLFAGPALGKPWRADPDDMVEQAELFGNAPGMLADLRGPRGPQPLGLTELRARCCCCGARKDVILLPRQGRRFERLIPGAELSYLKGLGHAPMSDDPELLVRDRRSRRSPRSGGRLRRAQRRRRERRGDDHEHEGDALDRRCRAGRCGIGSPKTRMPPLMAVMFAAALVSVMTGTASPF